MKHRSLAATIAVSVALCVPAAAYASDPTLTAAKSLLGGHEGSLHAAGADRRPARARELTLVLRALAARLGTMTGADRREAVRLLERPTDGNADPQQNGYTATEAPGSPFCSAHYCVHWVASGSDAPDLTDVNANGIPDYVETVASVAEHVHAVENDQLGWRLPKGDGALGGGRNLTDIYLKNLGGTGIYGYTAPDPGQPGATSGSNSLYAYLVVDNTFDRSKFPHYASPVQPLEVTLAHEYNHVLQFNYDALEDTWMFESTAVWMEGKVYAELHDYFQYLPGWVSLTSVPLTAFDGVNPNDRSNVKVYGSSVWNKWLDSQYGQDVVRDAWADSLSTRPASFAPAAYNASIRAHGGRGFFDAFSRFSVATAEWQAQGSGFPDGAAYPDVQRVGTVAAGGAHQSLRLDHTTFALLNVPRTSAPRIKLIVTAPRNVASAIGLVGRAGPSSGGVETVQMAELVHGGRGAVTLTNPGAFARLTAVVVNADSSERGYSLRAVDWLFTKNAEPYGVRVTSDFTSPRLRIRSPRPGTRNVGTSPRIAITFTKPVFGVSVRSVRLIGPGNHAVQLRVRFRAGSRTATLVPARGLRRGVRYRIKLLATITDTDLNPLAAVSWTFSTRR
jgi:hypothetical protein